MRSLLVIAGLTLRLVALAIPIPTGLVVRSGDLSVVLHWDAVVDPTLAGYRLYRASAVEGPFRQQHSGLLTTPGFCDLSVSNDQTNYYRVTAVTSGSVESAPSTTLAVVAARFCERR